MTISKKLKDHYNISDSKSLFKSADPENRNNIKRFFSFDGFHTRGKEAFLELIGMADITEGTSLLDIGCGTGGSSRLIAEKFENRNYCIDISKDYVKTAKELGKDLFLNKNLFFVNAMGDFLPFKNNSFDIAITEHVHMNIKDKSQFFSEVYRVLKPGGCFLFHEVYSSLNNDIQYPLPWAEDCSISFLISEKTGQDLLEKKGFKIDKWNNKNEISYEFFLRVIGSFNRVKSKPGLNLVMGKTYQQKVKNMAKNLEKSCISIIMGKALKER